MAKQKSYVVGVLGVLAGLLIGVAGSQRAEMVSFAGANPNTAAESRDFREENSGQYRNNRINNYDRPAAKRRIDLRDIARARAASRLRNSAPSYDNGFEECHGLSGMRLTRCIWSSLNDEPYSPNDWGM